MNMDEISLNMIANLKVAKPVYAETFLYAAPVTSKKQLQIYEENFIHGRKSKRTIQAIVTSHALQRWNERVGPKMSSKNLQSILETIIALQPWRMQQVAHNTWCLDQEIYFIAQQDGKKLKLITFLGRASLRPLLKRLRDVQAYVLQKQGRLHLALTEQELASAACPIFPTMMMYVTGNTTNYWLEHFQTANGGEPIVLCSIYNSVIKKHECYWIDLAKPEERPLHRKVLNVLYKWGYHEFLRSYYAIHDQKQVEKTAARMRRKVERRQQYAQHKS